MIYRYSGLENKNAKWLDTTIAKMKLRKLSFYWAYLTNTKYTILQYRGLSNNRHTFEEIGTLLKVDFINVLVIDDRKINEPDWDWLTNEIPEQNETEQEQTNGSVKH
jgi:hypothetical protein